MPITNAATQNSTTAIPANAVVTRCAINVEVGYSVGATIAVGRASSASLLMGTADSDATTVNLYDAPQTTSWGATAATVLVTVAGAPAAGSGHVLVEYSIPGS